MKLASPKIVEGCSCEPVSEINSIVKTAEDMFQLMTGKRGIGLAAPQVGIFKRFFIIKNFSGPGYELFVNPTITWKCDKLESFKEGCLTYQSSGNPQIVVKRPKSIMATWQIADGSYVTKRMKGLTAQVFQHEADHLDGITIKNKGNK